MAACDHTQPRRSSNVRNLTQMAWWVPDQASSSCTSQSTVRYQAYLPVSRSLPGYRRILGAKLSTRAKSQATSTYSVDRGPGARRRVAGGSSSAAFYAEVTCHGARTCMTADA
nr:hypothetical protein 8D4.120 [imported] - Neurospora crassa [Neurospora crassa]